MKTHCPIRLVFVSAWLLFCSAFYAQDAVDLIDSNHHDWTTSWRPQNGCSIVDNPRGRHGRVLKQELPATFTKGDLAWRRTTPMEPGARYRLQAFYQLDNVEKAYVLLHFIYPDGVFMEDSHHYRLITPHLSGTQKTWTKLVYEFAAPAGADFVRIALQLNSPGTVYWDNPSLIKITDPKNVSYIEDEQSYCLDDPTGVVSGYVFDDWPIEKYQQVNIKWVRWNALWQVMERKGRGQWNEEHLAHSVQETIKAKAAGINPFVSLGYPPNWSARETSIGQIANRVVAKDQQDWINQNGTRLSSVFGFFGVLKNPRFLTKQSAENPDLGDGLL